MHACTLVLGGARQLLLNIAHLLHFLYLLIHVIHCVCVFVCGWVIRFKPRNWQVKICFTSFSHLSTPSMCAIFWVRIGQNYSHLNKKSIDGELFYLNKYSVHSPWKNWSLVIGLFTSRDHILWKNLTHNS